MIKKLFPDQETVKIAANKALAKHKHIIVQAATGWGKTVLISDIIRSALAPRTLTDGTIRQGKTVLVLTESTNIFSQLHEECGGTEIKAGGKDGYLMPGQCYVAMCQSLINRPMFLKQLAEMGSNLLLIADEAHLNHMTDVISLFPDAYRIGFTATPALRWARHLTDLYKAIVCGPQVDELISMGRLSPYKYYARVAADENELKIVRGEFSESSQAKAFEKQAVYNKLFDDLKNIPYTKCMIFAGSIQQAEDIHQQLIMQGFRSCRYHSKMHKLVREDELKAFTERHDADICVSVAALNKGWDYKPVDLIILLVATTSLPRFLQSIGRGSRVVDMLKLWIWGIKNYKGKTHFTVLDYGGNWKRHGLYDWERDWPELWCNAPKKKDGVAPVKMCPKCEYINNASAAVCKDCGHVFEKAPPPPAEEGKLVEVTAEYEKMRGRSVSDLNCEELAVYAKLKNKAPYAIRIARVQEQTRPGFLDGFAKAMGYKGGWANHQRTLMEQKGNEKFFDTTLR